MEEAPLPFVLIGMAAAGERGTRAVVSVGVRAVGVATKPAAFVWRSSLATPLRDGANDAASGFARDGRDLVTRRRARARETATETLKRLEKQVDNSDLIDQVIDRVLSSGSFDRLIAAVINHPATEALIVKVLDDPGLDRLISRVMESRLVDELVAQLLASEEMQLILDYVTRSPELRAALAHQTVGLADDVADGVRSRTFVADATAERLARTLIRRRRQPEPPK